MYEVWVRVPFMIFIKRLMGYFERSATSDLRDHALEATALSFCMCFHVLTADTHIKLVQDCAAVTSNRSRSRGAAERVGHVRTMVVKRVALLRTVRCTDVQDLCVLCFGIRCSGGS